MRTFIALYLILTLTKCSTNKQSEILLLQDKYFSYEQKGQYDSARIIAEVTLKKSLDYFSKNDIRVGISYNNLAEMYRELGQREKAIPLYNNAIEIAENNNDTLNIILFSSNLGLAYYYSNKLELARNTNQYAIDIAGKKTIDKSLFVPYIQLGQIEFNTGNLNLARTNFEKALECVKKNHKTSDKEFGDVYKFIGSIFLQERRNDSAFYYLSKSKLILENIYGKNHSNLNGTYGLLGVYYHVTQNYDSALTYYLKDIKTSVSLNGQSTSRDYLTYKNLAQLYIDMRDSVKANEVMAIVNNMKLNK